MKIRSKLLLGIALAVLAILHWVPVSAAPYYEGKTINVLIPAAAGGGLTRTARTFMKAYARYIEGNPTIVIRNMPGSTKALNFLAGKAKSDGMTLLWGPLQFTNVISGAPGVLFDPGKFEIIGAGSSNFVTIIRTDTPPGIKTASDLLKTKTFVYGGPSPGRVLDMLGRLSFDVLGVKYRYVPGYRGQAKQNPAIRSKEIQALTTGEAGYHAFYRDTILKDGTAVAVYYHSPFDVATGEPIRSGPAKIKHFVDFYKQVFGKNPAGPTWEAYKWIASYETWPFAIVAPAGTPKTAVVALRKAYSSVPNDSTFQEQWKKQFRLLPKFLTGEKAQSFMRLYRNISPGALAVLKKAVAPGK